MNSLVVAVIGFACSFGGTALGYFLRAVLPASHLDDDSKEVLKLGTGFIGTLAALVLGLLVASATTEFNSESDDFERLATDVVLLDRALKHYGPEASGARDRLRQTVASFVKRVSPPSGSRAPAFDAPEVTTLGGSVFDSIRALSPQNDAQRAIQTQAVQIGLELAKTRLALRQGQDGSIPRPFLVVLMFWLAVLFTGFGLLSPRNPTVIVVLFTCALSVAGAMFLIMDLDEPFEGLIQISSDSLRDAVSQLGK
jgi:hypothetical protein